MGATQSIHAVPANGGSDRPLYRDEAPEGTGTDTAEFAAQGYDDYEDYYYDDYDGYDYEDGDAYDREPRARTRKVLMGAAFLALLLIAGGGAFFFASGGISLGGTDAATVANEDEDPDTLAPDELFPESFDIEGQGSFTRVAVDDSEDCSGGTHGEYGQVLTDNDCRQLVRASYLSEDESQAVTIGVAAMPTDAEAETALAEQDLVASEWFAGLPGEGSPAAEDLGHSGGHGSSGQWGRYVLFSFASDGELGQDGEDGGEDATELRDVGEDFLDELFDQLDEDRS